MQRLFICARVGARARAKQRLGDEHESARALLQRLLWGLALHVCLGLLPLQLSNIEKERLALNVMVLVARGHATGAPLWTVDTLSRELGMPGLAVADLVAGLEGARLLVDREDERLFPARDAAHIRLVEILDAVRQQRQGQMTAVPAEEQRETARVVSAIRGPRGKQIAIPGTGTDGK